MVTLMMMKMVVKWFLKVVWLVNWGLGAPRTLKFNEFAELFWFFYCDWAIRGTEIESFIERENLAKEMRRITIKREIA